MPHKDPEKRKEYMRQYYLKHPDKRKWEDRKEWAKEYNKKNKAIKRAKRIADMAKYQQIQRDYYQSHKKQARAKTARYKAAKLLRTPKWLSKEELKQIEQFYINCPPDHEIDHIVPLQGKLVSGLHVLANLQYLPISENRSKHNKFPYNKESV
jgi:hypothetical protein